MFGISGCGDVPDVYAEPAALEGILAPERDIGVYFGAVRRGIEQTRWFFYMTERVEIQGSWIVFVTTEHC